MAKYKKSIYRKLTVNADLSIRVYHVKKDKRDFFITTLIYPKGEIPLAVDEAPWKSISRAKYHPLAREIPGVLDALTFLYHLV